MKRNTSKNNQADEDVAIESGLAMPRPSNKRYPFDAMEVGDSFLIPEGRQQSVSACSCGWAERDGTGKKFSVRIQKDGTYRCWRLK